MNTLEIILALLSIGSMILIVVVFPMMVLYRYITRRK